LYTQDTMSTVNSYDLSDCLRFCVGSNLRLLKVTNEVVIFVLFVIVSLGLPSTEATYMRSSELANSPIYYISAPAFSPYHHHSANLLHRHQSMGLTGANGVFTPPNVFLNVLRQVHTTHKKRRKQAAAAVRPSATVGSSSVSGSSSSTIYRLPIKFLSNAKPIEVITSE